MKPHLNVLTYYDFKLILFSSKSLRTSIYDDHDRNQIQFSIIIKFTLSIFISNYKL